MEVYMLQHIFSHRSMQGGETTVKQCIKNSCTASGCRVQFSNIHDSLKKEALELKKIVQEYYSDFDS